jgi:hypothetical protein
MTVLLGVVSGWCYDQAFSCDLGVLSRLNACRKRAVVLVLLSHACNTTMA